VQIYNYPTVDSCGAWTRYRAENSAQALEGWVLGFISGANAFRPGSSDLAPGTTADGLLGWIDQYCQKNPLDSVTTAGFKLVGELDRRRNR
jgi:hypothetical protein